MQELPKKVEIIKYESFIQAIRNSVGTNLFRNLYAEVDGRKMDILKNGGLSCPVFVSSVLYLHKLISDVHATVDGAIRDLLACGWHEIDKPRPGAILVWEAKDTQDTDGDVYDHHRHIGFYIDDSVAVSNNMGVGQPTMHHWTFGEKNGQPARKVERIYWHPKLNK